MSSSPPALPARARRRRRRSAGASMPKRPELVAGEVERRHEEYRERLRDELPEAEHVEEQREPQLVEREGGKRYRVEARALQREAALLVDEGPVAVPPVVARCRDDERDGCRAVCADPEQRLVDGEVDDEAARADDAEPRQLDPVVTPAERRHRAGRDGHGARLPFRARVYAALSASCRPPSSSSHGSSNPVSAYRRALRR